MMPMAKDASKGRCEACIQTSLHIRRESLLSWIHQGMVDRKVEKWAIDSLAKVAKSALENVIQLF
jgi:hypothetical protein